MLVSLNDLVQMLADRVSAPFSIPLQEELKVILNYKRAEYVQRIVEKNYSQRKYFLKYFSDSLVNVDRAECPLPASGCTVKRTSKKIPLPTRTSVMLFDYVGDSDRLDGYTYTTPDQLIWIIRFGSKYTKDRPKYFYVNNYVYIYNEDSLDNITIGGIYSDPRQLEPFKCAGVPCYTDDDQYEIPDDIINTMIQDVLRNEIRILISPEQGEISVDDETKN